MPRHKPKQFYYGRSPGIYIPTPKPKKEFKFPFSWIKITFLFAVLISLIYLFFFSSFFAIKTVRIYGTGNQEIINSVQKIKGQNLWLFDKKELSSELLKFAEINGVKISRWPLNTIKINITEKKQGIIWISQNKFYLIDEDGFVMKEVIESESLKDLPKVVDTKNIPIGKDAQVVNSAFVNFIKNLSSEFTQKTDLKLVEIDVPESIFEINVKIESIYFKMDPMGDLGIQLDYAEKAYREKKNEIKEYVDLTTWDKGIVVYK